jgi:hypothetical protein
MSWGRFWAPAALLSALLIAPAFRTAMVNHTIPLEDVVLRFTIGMVALAVGMAAVAELVSFFHRDNAITRIARTGRRSTDQQKPPEA